MLGAGTWEGQNIEFARDDSRLFCLEAGEPGGSWSWVVGSWAQGTVGVLADPGSTCHLPPGSAQPLTPIKRKSPVWE